jgi:hypothetical protein
MGWSTGRKSARGGRDFPRYSAIVDVDVVVNFDGDGDLDGDVTL